MGTLNKGINVISIGNFVDLIKGGQVFPNEHNRQLNRTKVESIKSRFCPANLEAILVDEGGKITSGHHRTAAIVELSESGSLGGYLDKQMVVNVVPKDISLSTQVNSWNTTAHSLADMLTNKDIPVVQRIDTYLKGLHIYDNRKLVGGFATYLIANILAYTEGEELVPDSLNQGRNKIAKYMRSQGEFYNLRITHELGSLLREAIDYYQEFITAYVGVCEKHGEKVTRGANTKIINGKLLFGIFIYDFLTEGRLTRDPAAKTAKRIHDRKETFVTWLGLFTQKPEDMYNNLVKTYIGNRNKEVSFRA